MIKTVTFRVETPADRTLRIPLPPDVPDGPLEVVLVIASSERREPATEIAGRWQPYFPTDLDIDHALRELRHEWEDEWSEDEP